MIEKSIDSTHHWSKRGIPWHVAMQVPLTYAMEGNTLNPLDEKASMPRHARLLQADGHAGTYVTRYHRPHGGPLVRRFNDSNKWSNRYGYGARHAGKTGYVNVTSETSAWFYGHTGTVTLVSGVLESLHNAHRARRETSPHWYGRGSQTSDFEPQKEQSQNNDVVTWYYGKGASKYIGLAGHYAAPGAK